MKRYLRVLVCVVVFVSTAPSWSEPFGSLQEWDTSPLRPYGAAVLRDGSAWFTVRDETRGVGNQVFTIDPNTGSTMVFVAPFTGAMFETLTADASDKLWIADSGQNQLVHFDPATGEFAAFPLDPALFGSDALPFGVTIAPDDAIWLTCRGNPALARFDPTSETWERFVAEEFVAAPMMMAFDSSGNVWFTLDGRTGGISGLGMLNPFSGEFREWNDSSTFTSPFGIAVVDDQVWFLDHHGNRLSRFDPDIEAFTHYSTEDAGLIDPHFFVVDGRGTFWMTGYASSNLGIFSPSTETFDKLALTDRSGPMSIALDPDEILWIAESFDTEHGGVGRFATSALPLLPDIPERPLALGFALVALWVTAGWCATPWRIPRFGPEKPPRPDWIGVMSSLVGAVVGGWLFTLVWPMPAELSLGGIYAVASGLVAFAGALLLGDLIEFMRPQTRRERPR